MYSFSNPLQIDFGMLVAILVFFAFKKAWVRAEIASRQGDLFADRY